MAKMKTVENFRSIAHTHMCILDTKRRPSNQQEDEPDNILSKALYPSV